MKRSLLCILILFTFSALAQAEPHRSTFTITVLHTNDMHGHMLPEIDREVSDGTQRVGGAAWMAGLIEGTRARNHGHVLLIDAGDVAQGTPISNMFRGRPMVEFMNGLPYDAGTLGNHEFDWGPHALSAMIRQARRPIVCANLLDRRTGLPPAGVKRFVIKRVGDVKVGITGLITPTTPDISFRDNVKGFRFLPEAGAMRSVIRAMRRAGARVIIVASHLGDDADRALALAVPGINVIVGGHTHKALFDPLFVNGTIIVQAGRYMRYLGRLDVTFDRHTWKAIDYTHHHELIAVIDANIQPDPKVAALVAKYEAQVAPAMDQVLGEAAEDLTRSPVEGCFDSALGDVLTDAIRWKVGADVAIYNAGGIRSDFNKGPIHVGEVYTALPFDNRVVTVTLTGDQLRRVVAQGLGRENGTLQVSGLTCHIRADGQPIDIEVGGRPLQSRRRYKVATVDFLADGNDGFTVFKESKDRVYDELARDVFTAYLRKATPLRAPKPHRIKREAVP